MVCQFVIQSKPAQFGLGRPVSRTAFVEALHALFALAEAARRLAMPTLPAILRGEA